MYYLCTDGSMIDEPCLVGWDGGTTTPEKLLGTLTLAAHGTEV